MLRDYITRVALLFAVTAQGFRRRTKAVEVVRRHRFDDFTESRQETLVAAAVPLKTKQATDFWWGVFHCFCREKGISVDVTTISAGALANILIKFYSRFRTKKGETYQATSYLSARAAYNGSSLPPTDSST